MNRFSKFFNNVKIKRNFLILVLISFMLFTFYYIHIISIEGMFNRNIRKSGRYELLPGNKEKTIMEIATRQNPLTLYKEPAGPVMQQSSVVHRNNIHTVFPKDLKTGKVQITGKPLQKKLKPPVTNPPQSNSNILNQLFRRPSRNNPDFKSISRGDPHNIPGTSTNQPGYVTGNPFSPTYMQRRERINRTLQNKIDARKGITRENVYVDLGPGPSPFSFSNV